MPSKRNKWLAGLLCAGLVCGSLPLTTGPVQARPLAPAVNYGPWAPEEMMVTPDSLKAKETGQIQVRFDRNYSPAAGDQLLVEAFDGQGKRLDQESQALDLADQAVYQVLSLPVTPSAQAAKYVVRYQGAPGNQASLSKEIKVTGGLADSRLEVKYANAKVAPGDTVAAPALALVDGAGNRQTVSDVTYTVTGAVVEDSLKEDGSFVVAGNAPLGSRIIVKASSQGLSATASFTVTRSNKTDGTVLQAKQTEGPAGQDNEVTFVLTQDGKALNLDWQPTVVRVEFLDGAKALGYAVDIKQVSQGGEGKLVLKSEAPADVKWRLVLSDNAGHRLVSGSADFSFTAATGAEKERAVSLTIGSNNLVIDGDQIQTMDTVPVVVNDRTYVPYRAVAQAFGAKVDYSHASRTVTTSLAGQKVVMTIGQKAYTVNGEQKYMDVAPYVNQAGRTMVPVRFVAEALGFKVKPLYQANGATQGVAFSK